MGTAAMVWSITSESSWMGVGPDAAEACRWQLRELDIDDGYKAALAVEGAQWTLKR